MTFTAWLKATLRAWLQVPNPYTPPQATLPTMGVVFLHPDRPPMAQIVDAFGEIERFDAPVRSVHMSKEAWAVIQNDPTILDQTFEPMQIVERIWGADVYIVPGMGGIVHVFPFMPPNNAPSRGMS